jgi:peptidoglycan L-alanyl-D-glutamate endopeptidase CwlK
MNSKHLTGNAVDLAPYPIDWKNTKRFYHFAGIVLGVATEMGIRIRWGGDWDMDDDLDDQSFMDLVHFEIVS